MNSQVALVSDMQYNYCVMEKNRISLNKFRKAFLPMICFSGEQVRLWRPDFGRDNFARWIASGEILRLRQNLYTFPEYLNDPDSALYFANQIYQPSYISLHTALHFYGLIPEEVVQFTSVSTLKTAFFQNDFGTYSYRHVSDKYMFGYELMRTEGKMPFVVKIATPEKAVIDLLHLYPEYKTADDMAELRLDEEHLDGGIDQDKLMDHVRRIGSPALAKRVDLFREVYGLL